VNLLLDTHIALWAVTDSKALPKKARMLISDEQNTVFVSAASIWEISIKSGLGRGQIPMSGSQALKFFELSGYRLLPVEPQHAASVEMLEPIHSDPFDRILVAQALTVPLRLLTHDKTVARYSDTIIFV
jgi:PIN domain nuclease of toxin-antitoxin system